MSTSAIYPEGIASALGHLNSSRNEIEVFVEDTSSTNVWRAILRRFLPEGVKFRDPIPLGGRTKVLEECRNDQKDDNRKKIYIIDADLDLLLGRPTPQLRFLYRINAYCIENYLISKSSIVELAEITNPDVSPIDAEAILDLDSLIDANRSILYRTFVCYAINEKLSGGLVSVGYHVSRLTLDHPNTDILCIKKSGSRVFRMYRQLVLKFGLDVVRKERNEIMQRANIGLVEKLVSGKTYLLPLIFSRIRRDFGRGMSDDQMKVVLAKTIDTSIDVRLRTILGNISV